MIDRQDITAERLAAAAARRQEERFELAMRGANDGLWDWDLATSEVFYSTRWKSMLGYGDDEVEGHITAFERLVHPTDRDPTFHAVQTYLTGISNRYEVHLRMRHKAGHYVDTLSRGFAARDAAGQPIRLVGTHLDISEQVRSEQRMRAQIAATHVLATATTLMETMPRLLMALGDPGLWSAGVVWVVDPSADVLRALCLWSAPDLDPGPWSTVARSAAIPRGEAAAGLAWASGVAIWTPDLAVTPWGNVGVSLGFRSTFAVPIVVGGRTVAVMQFCGRDVRQRDDRWLQMLESLHALASHVLERRQDARDVPARTV